MVNRVALYARVSSRTDEQNPENQAIKLKEWARTARINGENVEVVGEFVDELSSRDTRPKKEEVLRLLRTRQVDGVVFVSLDRWGRTTSELVLEFDEFIRHGWIMVSLKEGMSLDTAAGQLHARMLAAFAEFERERIRERTLAGVERARIQGKIGGRHPVDCGYKDEQGNRHDGAVKPVRDDARVIAWLFPDGTEKSVGCTRHEPPLQFPLLPKGRCMNRQMPVRIDNSSAVSIMTVSCDSYIEVKTIPAASDEVTPRPSAPL